MILQKRKLLIEDKKVKVSDDKGKEIVSRSTGVKATGALQMHIAAGKGIVNKILLNQS